MDLRHLRYFLAVAEELSFTRAALRLGLGQPPLSQQIQQLEQEIGARLFERLPRGVVLTAAGQRLQRDARAILAQTEQALVQARRAGRGELGTLRIGFTSSASFHPFVTAAIRDYRAAFPDVGLELFEETTAQLLGRFRTHRLDAAFLRPAPGEAESWEEELLFEEPMMVALPAGHALAGEAALPLAALSEQPFVLYPRRNGRALYDAIVDACRAAGFSPRVEQEAPQMASTVTLIATGLGISLVPESMGQLLAQGVTYRPILGPAPVARLALVWQTGTAAEVTRAFTALVRARLGRRAAPVACPGRRP
jgi:DNA-binding transcriptional LysR family regulator